MRRDDRFDTNIARPTDAYAQGEINTQIRCERLKTPNREGHRYGWPLQRLTVRDDLRNQQRDVRGEVCRKSLCSTHRRSRASIGRRNHADLERTLGGVACALMPESVGNFYVHTSMLPDTRPRDPGLQAIFRKV